MPEPGRVGGSIHIDARGPRRVALLEDHGLLASTLAAALTGRGIEVRVIDPERAEDLVHAVLASDPELALVDLHLGARGSAIDLIRPLTASGLPVVVVTGVTDAVEQARCVAAGAVGVVSKRRSFDDLIGSIEQALQQGRLLGPAEREEHLAVLRDHTVSERARLAPFEQLTPREAEVLGALVRGRSVEQIAQAEMLAVTTIRSHIRGVLTKLGATSQLAAVARATEAGWRPPPER